MARIYFDGDDLRLIDKLADGGQGFHAGGIDLIQLRAHIAGDQAGTSYTFLTWETGFLPTAARKRDPDCRTIITTRSYNPKFGS